MPAWQLVGKNHHRGNSRWPREQRNGQGHHSNARALVGRLHLRFIGFGLGRLGVDHRQSRYQEQQTAADLKARQRNAEKLQHIQPHQGAGRNHDKHRQAAHACDFAALFFVHPLGVMDKKWHHRQWIDDGQQSDEVFEVHGFFLCAAGVFSRGCSPCHTRWAMMGCASAVGCSASFCKSAGFCANS